MHIQELFSTYFYDYEKGMGSKILKAIRLPAIPAVGTFVNLESTAEAYEVAQVILVEHENTFLVRCLLRKIRSPRSR
jgi:hypothetical protein